MVTVEPDIVVFGIFALGPSTKFNTFVYLAI